MIAMYPSEAYEQYDQYRSYPPMRRPKIQKDFVTRHRKKMQKPPVNILIPKNKELAFGKPRKPVIRGMAVKDKPITQKNKIEKNKKDNATTKAKTDKTQGDQNQKQKEKEKKIARDTPSKTSKIVIISLSITTLLLTGYVLWQRQKINKL